MSDPKYYDGTKLLSMKDINGDTPEIFMCTSNRSGGKTTYFNRLLVNRFLKDKEKFMLIYRFSYELDDCADAFFGDIKTLFFPGHEMHSEVRGKGLYRELFMDNRPCGYAIALNQADMIKKRSHLFSDTKRMLMDEFQSENNKYCPKEVQKFISVHSSIARGQGQQARYLPVYMLSNPVSIINPYYVEMGISHRLRDDTNFLRGDGWVLENGFIETASRAQKESAFNRAFAGNSYVAYSSEATYLNDNKAFIEKPEGFSRYICTLKYNGQHYAVREFGELGIIYIDHNADMTCKALLTVTLEDHTINYVMLGRADFFIIKLRDLFNKGCFRFKDLQCKEALMTAISYQ